MNKLFARVGTVVGAAAAFALLCSVGYFTQIGLSQSFGPPAAGNSATPPRNKPRGNYSYSNSPEGHEQERKPIPEDESVWEDYPESSLDNKERLARRPGNFEVVKKVGEFF
ncbi:MAG: hypothetical protein IPK87_01465 [Planctomycetes bacterium]|nr:hypothetical protein [Planctomycetota bacterium]